MSTDSSLEALGFMVRKGGTHTSRTIMLEELTTLFGVVPADADPDAYQSAIRAGNCLGKQSGRTRDLTARHLAELYALDPANPIYAGLRWFWDRDPPSRPLLALLAACARDSLLRDLLPGILAAPIGAQVTREAVESQIEKRWPGRFSTATCRSTAQNVNSSLTKAGYLNGRIRKTRIIAEAPTGAVAFALYLGWLQGERGEMLLYGDYASLLDIKPERILELASTASARGWLVLRRVDSVIDIDFPALLPVVEAARAGQPRQARPKVGR